MSRRTSIAAVAVFAVLAAALVARAAAVAPVEALAFGRGPDIVLVHGLGGSTSDWLPTARVLARSHRVWLADLPGHGDTAMPRWFTLDRAARSLDAALPADRPVVLVGHSLGGLVCAAEAMANPARVRALVLVEAALAPQLDGATVTALTRELDARGPSLVRDAFTGFARDSAQGATRAAAALAVDRDVMRRWIRLAWTADLAGARPRLAMPVMVVLAPRSWDRGERWHDVAAQLGYGAIARVTPVRLRGCGHFVMLDRPAELARLIDAFAARAPRS